MNYKKIFIISFLMAVVYFLFSYYYSLEPHFETSFFEYPWIMIWGHAFQGGKQTYYLIGSLFVVFWLISFALTVLFFLIKNRKTEK